MPFALVAIVAVSAVLHAGWNLAAHSQRSNGSFFRQLTLVAAAIGIGPAIFFELTGAPLPSTIWLLLGITGLFQALYYFGLTQGYRHGDFSVVYPVARALPVLVLAGVDMLRGRPPSGPGWLGLLLVFAGCFLAPQVSLRQFSLKRYWNRASIWIGVIAAAMVGYTTVDKIALEMMPPGLPSAVRYGALEYLAVVPFVWLLTRAADVLRLEGAGLRTAGGWKWPALSAVFMVAAYWLVLWAYQLSPQASYVAALRQMSLVIGTVVAVTLFHEPGAPLRVSAAGLITIGVFVIALAG